MEGLPDAAMFEKARQERRVVLTFNLDFGDLLAAGLIDSSGTLLPSGLCCLARLEEPIPPLTGGPSALSGPVYRRRPHPQEVGDGGTRLAADLEGEVGESLPGARRRGASAAVVQGRRGTASRSADAGEEGGPGGAPGRRGVGLGGRPPALRHERRPAEDPLVAEGGRPPPRLRITPPPWRSARRPRETSAATKARYALRARAGVGPTCCRMAPVACQGQGRAPRSALCPVQG